MALGMARRQQQLEAMQLVVSFMWRSVRLEESEQSLGHTGKYGPP